MGLGSVVWEAPGGRALGGRRAGVWLGDVARCPAWHRPTHGEQQQGWRFGEKTPEMGKFVPGRVWLAWGATWRGGTATVNPPGSHPGDSSVTLCAVALSSGHSIDASVPQFPHPVSPPFPWGLLGPGQLVATVTHPGLAQGPAAIPVPVPPGAVGASSCPRPASRWHRSSFPPPFAFFRGFLGFFFQEKPQTRAERIKGLAGAQGMGRGSSEGARQGPRQPTAPKIGVSLGTRGPAACPLLPRAPWNVAAGGKLRHGAVHTRVPVHTCV